MTQSEADLSVGHADEGDTDREIRELTQQLMEAQQEVMTAQAECDRVLRTEQEAFEAWESKRSAHWFRSPPCLLTRRVSSSVRLSLAVHHLGIVCCVRGGCQLLPAWAVQYNTWLLIKLTPKGVVFSFLSAAALMLPGTACTCMQLQSSSLHFKWLQLQQAVLPQCMVCAQDMYSTTEGLLHD